MSWLYLWFNPCAFFHYFCTRDCGRSRRPAFPAPSSQERDNEIARLGRIPAARMRELGCLKIESERDEATLYPLGMPGASPGHPRLDFLAEPKTWMAGHRRAQATPSFGRL